MAYIVVAFVAYVLFFYYSCLKFNEEKAIMEAEFLAESPPWLGLEPDYPFLGSVYGRNVFWGGIVLVWSILSVAMVTFLLLDRKERS